MKTLYEKIATSIEEQILTGSLTIGDRIPSTRSISNLHQVSMTTVIQAYLLLEKRGLIESRPKSGFYVRAQLPEASEPQNIFGAKKAQTVQIESPLEWMVQETKSASIVRLGAADPSSDFYPNSQLNRMMRKILAQHPFHSAEYDYPPGNECFREQIAKRSVFWGCKFLASQVITTCGATEAIRISLQAITDPGDTVAVESPTYFGILQILESLKLKTVEIPSHSKDGIDLEYLKKLLEKTPLKACVLTPNFNNPCGSMMPEPSKKDLVNLLAKNKVYLIEDDIYGDLAFNGIRPKAVKSYDHSDELVFLCSSFSKTLAPGYRVGWVIPPKRFYKRIAHLRYTSTLSTPSLPQMVIAEYLKTGGYDRHIRKFTKLLLLNSHRVIAAVLKYFPPGTRISRPQGGIVVWVELPSQMDSRELFKRAISKGISILPGVFFSAQGLYKNYIRISHGQRWTEKEERAIRSLGMLCYQLL